MYLASNSILNGHTSGRLMATSSAVGKLGVHQIKEDGALCIPGDAIVLLSRGAAVVIGKGLKRNDNIAVSLASGRVKDVPNVPSDVVVAVVATVGGIVRSSASSNGHKFWVDIVGGGHRYMPAVGDVVVGVVARGGGGMTYPMNINANTTAMLDGTAFDGATKQNRPKLSTGDFVYAHVSAATRSMEPELSCCALPGMKAKDWVTGEAVFGQLKGGTVTVVSTQFACDILRFNATNDLAGCTNPNAGIIAKLGAQIPFEAAVGANGAVWINSPNVSHVIAAVQMLQFCETEPPHIIDKKLAALFVDAA